MAGHREHLAQYDQAYDEAEIPEGTGGTLPDGRHTVTITDSQIEEATWGSVQWTLRFENEHGSVRKWSSLDDPDRLGYVKADLVTLGYTSKLSELEGAVGSFVGCVCEITVQRKTRESDGKVFTNVYLNTVLGRDEVAVAAGASDDDIPF